MPRSDQLTDVRFSSPSRLRLRFADGKSFTLPIGKTELPENEFKWQTVSVFGDGEAMEVDDVYGERIQIDAASLRSMADPEFSQKLDQQFVKLRGSLEDLAKTASEFLPPEEWYNEDY